VADRLSSLDASFLYLEDETTPMHIGGVALFERPAEGFDYEQLLSLISERIPFVPRFRQELKSVPGGLLPPVWVDDEHFDVSFHVRRSALPEPGTLEQLDELVSRIMSRPLDRTRPMWEMYLVEGLSNDRFAILTKTHHSMVDGVSSIDIGQVILDVSPEPREVPEDTWAPTPPPGSLSLWAGSVWEFTRRPTRMLDAVGRSASDIGRAGMELLKGTGAVMSAARRAARPAPSTSWNVTISGQRRFTRVDTLLDDYKRVRKQHGGTVNDVILAAVTGGLRAWMLTRGEPVTSATTIRAMVPVSVRAPEDETGGNRVAPLFVDLPVGEPNPVVRLQQISYRMTGHKESGQAVGADALVSLAGFAPSTIHGLAARTASGLSRRIYNVLVTNVPGPQFPLYAAGARMLAAYPVVPLAKAQGLGIGCTSYDGNVSFGLTADRDAVPDLAVLADCLQESMNELLGTLR
jgi:WS/DGAT/MGAT family acyltransferase